MPRHRSVSYYAKTEKEYLDKYEEYINDKDNTLFQRKRRRYKTSFSNDNEINENKDKLSKKKFSSYDDLEFNELGINSNYQIQNIEDDETDKETEIELLSKINNINISFKEKNKDNFVDNLLACSKNIIDSIYSSEKLNKFDKICFLNQKGLKSNLNLLQFESDNDNDNNLIEQRTNNSDKMNSDSLKSDIDTNEKQENNYDEFESINKNNPYLNNNNFIYESPIKEENNYINEGRKTERSQTFDNSKTSKWFYLSNEKGEKIDDFQNKKIQDYINKNNFLSKNIDYVDEHLKFLITGFEKNTKQLFINKILKSQNKEKEMIYGFNIFKKVIKLLGDYIKLELLVEDCNLCHSIMLKAYLSIVNGLILIIDINEPLSAKYSYDFLEKIKYVLNINKNNYSVICICFDIIEIDKTDKNVIKTKNIINKIKEDYNIKTVFIDFSLNNPSHDDKLENVINKFLSLAYLKKERKYINNKNIKNNRKKSSLN